ncbi:MAG: selenium-dependent molybdenum cofactor biosynthesis protein YqeB [Tissierellia bacterium]|nr:selenium-dependent molybdenum cofactor biosynthesis protein YqeB [Tissierellia bacterium]
MKGDIVIFRGGGDVATGSIQKLHRAGFRVLVLEVEKPLCIRRTVACARVIEEGRGKIEDFIATRCTDELDIYMAWEKDEVPVIVDPKGEMIKKFHPMAVIDAIIAKKNLGTHKEMAPITIALGPGFVAGTDVDVVIETNRGHDLGRLIFDGKAEENTGNPGNILGYTTERVLRSPGNGKIKVLKTIGDTVKKGETLALVQKKEVKAGLDGMIRGMITDGYSVTKGLKIGDVDPRINLRNTLTISDKARNIGGATLEAVLIMKRRKNL